MVWHSWLAFFFSFCTWYISSHSFLGCKVSTEKSVDDGLMDIPLLCKKSLILVVFKILFVFDFRQIDYNVVWCRLIWFYYIHGFFGLHEPCLLFPFPDLGSFCPLIFKIGLLFFSLFSFWDSHNAYVNLFDDFS